MLPVSIKVGHDKPTSETPFELRFAGGSLVAGDVCWLGIYIAAVNSNYSVGNTCTDVTL